MANIFAILGGQPGFDALCAMRLCDLMAWQERARARSGKEGS